MAARRNLGSLENKRRPLLSERDKDKALLAARVERVGQSQFRGK